MIHGKYANPNFFKKSEIARMLNIEPRMLHDFLPQSLRNEISFDDSHKRRRFSDQDAYKIIKYMRSMATHEQIMAMIYPRGIENGLGTDANRLFWAKRDSNQLVKQ